MNNWTDAQRAAINTFGRDLLVSAAAGSGKTAALTERIITALTREDRPTDITRILAVTFTRAAAGELRRRISSALSEKIEKEPSNQRLVKQLMLLGSAKICTIDSFCSDVVKSNFQRLDLPAGFRIPNADELKLLESSIMDDVIDERFETGGTAFAELADNLVAKNKSDANIQRSLCGVYKKLVNLPQGIEELKKFAGLLKDEADMDFTQTRAGKVIMTSLCERLDYYRTILSTACELFCENEKTKEKYLPAFSDDLNYCEALISVVKAGNYNEARTVAGSYSPTSLGRLSAADKSEEVCLYQTMRKNIVNEFKTVQKKYFPSSQTDVRELYHRTSAMLFELYETISQFENKLQKEKANRGICDFDDIRRSAFSLLVNPDGTPTEAAREYAERFDEIFIDEVQDVTEVQDLIFASVSNGHNRFMVGDIKQSIYGFRGAEPHLFASYRSSFKPYLPKTGENPEQDEETGTDGRTIFMSENFRCDKNVIDFVNLVCPRVFRACGDSIGYVASDDLVFAKKCEDGYVSPKVSVTLIVKPTKTDEAETPDEKNTQNDDDDETPEVNFVASEISRLLREEHRADGTRLCPGDIAVLCRTNTTCANISTALQSLGIPVNSDSADAFFSRPEVSLILSLLNVIDNPQKDIPLAAVLRSPIFGFTMDDLSRIREKSEKKASLYDSVIGYIPCGDTLAEKCAAFSSKLDSYRTAARALPTDRLIRNIYRDISALAFADSERGREAIRGLYEYARQFEAGSFKGLYNFINYIDRAIAAGSDGDAVPVEPDPAAVTVITIHHSKGLEFPVCFVAGCAKDFPFIRKESNNSFIFDAKLGPGMRLNDATGLARINTPLRTAALDRIKTADVEEEMRLLYVALTRARERLYVTAQYLRGKPENILSKAELERKMPGRFPIMTATRYLDWLLPALSVSPSDDAPYTFSMLNADEIPNALPIRLTYAPAEASTGMSPEKFAQKLKEKFNFVYPYRHLSDIPAKLSVSKLYPGLLDDDGSTELEEELPSLAEDQIKPAFMSKTQNSITSAEKGTATHVFLQFCDFNNCEARGIDAELERMKEKGFITGQMADAVDRNQLRRFFGSDFYASLRESTDLHREQRFNIMLPASRFSENPEKADSLNGEKLLVQGVIDIFFTDRAGKLILCDYKTDALTREELKDISLAAAKLTARHKTQLSYYAAALEQICHRKPDRVVIYSLPLGREIDITI